MQLSTLKMVTLNAKLFQIKQVKKVFDTKIGGFKEALDLQKTNGRCC